MQPIDIHRVTGSRQWDGIENCRVARLIPMRSQKRRLTKEEIELITCTVAFAMFVFGFIVKWRLGQ